MQRSLVLPVGSFLTPRFSFQARKWRDWMVKEWIGSGYPYKRWYQKETGNKRTVLINKRTDSWWDQGNPIESKCWSYTGNYGYLHRYRVTYVHTYRIYVTLALGLSWQMFSTVCVENATPPSTSASSSHAPERHKYHLVDTFPIS